MKACVRSTPASGMFVLCVSVALCACGSERESTTAGGASLDGIPIDGGGSSSAGSNNATGGDAGTNGNAGADDMGDKFDVGAAGSGGTVPCDEAGECDACVESTHTPCDNGTTDLFNAMGLNCPGDATVSVSVQGPSSALGVRTGFGNTNEWAPREGTAFAVIGSGFVVDLDMATPQFDPDDGPTNCNDDLGGEYDKGNTLPAPIRTTNVAGDCAADPSFLGTGDCSNTIETQFGQAGANDYTEVRIQATVPPSNNSLSYDFAFFSTEYPYYFGSGFNDMYIGWLESESWTGNISFDAQGQPISLNAGFLDFKDDGGGLPELAGTCMRQHAGTQWLSSTAPVTPGEEITLVLAVFDLADSALDSYVFLDNFGWGCDGTATPQTKPVG